MSDDLRELLSKARSSATAAGARIVRLDGLAPAAGPDEARWGLDGLGGRPTAVSGGGATATLTAAIELVLEAQHAAEPIGWVTLGNTSFYPPDLAESGVDLAALLVRRVHDVTAAARAAERLLRSGAFGLIVVGFGSARPAE